MTAATARLLENRRPGLARRFAMLVVVLAFALQSFITQTHIHGDDPGAAGILKVAAMQAPAHSKTPLHNGLADCPFCQAIVHAGTFVASATPLFILQFTWVSTAALFCVAPVAFNIAAHRWQSRAPPRL